MGMQTLQIPLLFIGGGNMAHAIIDGAQRAGGLDPKRVAVLDPNADRRSLFEVSFDDPGQAVAWLKGEGVRGCGVVLAVKPQMLGDATGGLRGLIANAGLTPMIISILAGTRSERIAEAMGEGARVVRVMPNTPASIGMGMSAIAGSDSSTEEDVEIAKALMGGVGETVEIDESMMDAFTAVAGSGPAYVFYLVEAMTKAAVSLGFDAESARTIVEQTVIGSSELLKASDEDAAGLRSKVTSKNGTTYAATTRMDGLGVMDAITAALTAARDRGVELASET